MLTPEAFQTATLRTHPRGDAVRRILSAALQVVDPGEAVRSFVHREADGLRIAGTFVAPGPAGRFVILGLGKASAAMALPLLDMLSDLSPRGLLIPKHAPRDFPANLAVHPGGHPVPDENSLQAGVLALDLAGRLGPDDILLCLVSGGGSALMSAPHPAVSLQDLQILTTALLSSGARIDEINTLRRRLDRLKAGGLARAAAPARVISLILSDVVGSPLEVIASGPTAPDPSTRADALRLLQKYNLTSRSIPPSIIHTLEAAPETPKPGDPIFARVKNILVGSNELALQAALEQAQREDLHVASLGSNWQGEARQAAAELCRILLARTHPRPFCLVAGGETTVTLRGRHGTGGRNQELALAAAVALDGAPDVLLVSLATDGEDGPTPAAGAVASGLTLHKAKTRGLTPQVFLDHNDSYPFFDALDDLLKPGPSGTNVNDLVFLFGF